MTSASFENSDLTNLYKLPDNPDLNKFEEEFQKCRASLVVMKNIVRQPLELHEKNHDEWQKVATKHLSRIKLARDNWDEDLEAIYTEQYMFHRDLAKGSLEKSLKYQKLYFYIETQVYGKLEEALVYQHLSKAGVDFAERAKEAKNQAAKNIQELSTTFDELNVASETMSRKLGVENGSTNLTGTAESLSTQRTEESFAKYLEEINKRIEHLDHPDHLPPAHGV